MHQKPFDDITVQEVLDRAGVGRSTFTHSRDKNNLFLSDVEDFFELFSTALTRRGANPDRLVPVTQLFGRLRDAREFYAALVASGKVNVVLALGRGYFARSIEEPLKLSGAAGPPIELSAQANALSGSLFALLDWWITKGMGPDPSEMDRLFHRMAWQGL